MAKKRPSALDALGDVAPPLNPKVVVEIAKEETTARYNKPATYRLPEDLIDELKVIAKTERVKISELVTFALQSFVQGYESGEVVLPKTEPTHYNLNF